MDISLLYQHILIPPEVGKTDQKYREFKEIEFISVLYLTHFNNIILIILICK